MDALIIILSIFVRKVEVVAPVKDGIFVPGTTLCVKDSIVVGT
jgi:hypothetical protein